MKKLVVVVGICAIALFLLALFVPGITSTDMTVNICKDDMTPLVGQPVAIQPEGYANILLGTTNEKGQVHFDGLDFGWWSVYKVLPHPNGGHEKELLIKARLDWLTFHHELLNPCKSQQ